MTWTYMRTEPGLWTVGWRNGEGWEPESDHGSPDAAADRCHYLNGGCTDECGSGDIEELRGQIEALAAEVRRLSHPVVKAVADLVDAVDREHQRAEAAHDLKDEANRRWLEAVTSGAQAGREGSETGEPLPNGVEGHRVGHRVSCGHVSGIHDEFCDQVWTDDATEEVSR